MKNIKKFIWKFLKSEDGPTAIEYAVMVALIIVVAIGAVQLLGSTTSNLFTNTSKELAPKTEEYN